MKHLKKAAAAVLAAAIAFSLAACRSAGQAPAPSPAAQQQEFDDFLMQDFISTMESEYTALHVYLQNPAAFGVDMSKVRPGLGSRPDIVSQRQALQAAEEAYGQFLSFDRSKLTAEQQDTYDIYEFQTALALAALALIALSGVLYIVMNFKLAKAFGHGVGFGLGLMLLHTLFVMVLAFGTSRYVHAAGSGEHTA